MEEIKPVHEQHKAHLDNATIVVRSSHERTEQVCAALAARQVPEGRVTIIHERPFSQAIRRAFEIGIDAGQKWTVALDADVLLRDNALTTMAGYLNNQPQNVFGMTGTLLDKLLDVPRACGVHMYRTELLPTAMQYIDLGENAIRPESTVSRQMENQGFAWLEVKENIVGVHDYEQYFRDIYRKTIVHAHKHTKKTYYAEKIWARLEETDTDYQVAQWGVRMGRVFEGDIVIDRKLFADNINHLLTLANISEKGVLNPADVPEDYVERLIRTYQPAPEYLEWMAEQQADNLALYRLRKHWQEHGWLRVPPYILAKTLFKLGRLFEAWSLAEPENTSPP